MNCGPFQSGFRSPPIYLPFSAVEAPLNQSPRGFVASPWGWGSVPFPWSTPFGWLPWSWYPFARVTEAGWSQGQRFLIQANPYYEVVDYAMPKGVQDMIIPFKVEKVNPSIMLNGPMIVNVCDKKPLTGLSFTVTNISTSMLAIQLNALLDSPYYRFKCMVSVAY